MTTQLKEKVGQVTEQEKIEIKNLFERKNALLELFYVVQTKEITNNELYEKLIFDLSKTKSNTNEWWARASKKYNWKKSETGSWNIDFYTNEIFLMNTSTVCNY